MNNKHSGLFYLSIFTGFILLFIAILYVNHEQSLSANIKITALPSVSKITINGASASQGSNRVKPGVAKVVVSLKGFNTNSQTVSISKGQTKSVTVALVANSNATSNWYETHPQDEKQAEKISSNNNDALAQQSLQNAPLIQLLPFVGGGLEFRVDYGNTPGSNAGIPVIYITAPTLQGQQDGLNWIKSVGYNPSDYNIQYVTAAVQPLNP